MYLIKTVALIYLLATSVSALAAASGSSPKGKPFVEINGQIVEVQGQLVTLEQRMDNVISRMAGYETRLSGLEAGIASLQAEGQALEQKLLDLESGLTTVEEIVAELEAKDLELQAELDAYGDTTGQLALDIDANLMLIESLTASLDDGVSGLQLLIGQIYEALEELQSVQDSLVGQMKLKQQILDGTCDEGFEFKGFQDGAHVCQEEAKSNGPIEVVHVVVSRELAFLYPYNLAAKIETETVNEWSTSRAGLFIAYCPNGSSLVGGGITAYPEYFLKNGNNSASFYNQSRDRWYADFDLKLVSGEDYRANPLWTPYILPCRRTAYSQCSSDPEDTWAVSVFAACAVVSSDYTFE